MAEVDPLSTHPRAQIGRLIKHDAISGRIAVAASLTLDLRSSTPKDASHALLLDFSRSNPSSLDLFVAYNLREARTVPITELEEEAVRRCDDGLSKFLAEFRDLKNYNTLGELP